MSESELDPRAEFISDLRKLATFLERHPHLPVPTFADVIAVPALGRSDTEARSEIIRIAKIIGRPPTYANGHFRAAIELGRVSYRAVAVLKESPHAADRAMPSRARGTAPKPPLPRR
ncbi:hypothetical protein ACWDLG_34545 [Nonomuraea sp. NPDC003727]